MGNDSAGEVGLDGRRVAAKPHAVSKLDRNWGVLAGAALCTFSGQPSVAYYTFGVFLSEIIAATHWKPQAIAAAIGPGALTAALVSPFVGMACDRFGVRTVAMVGAPLFAAGFAFLGLFPSGPASFTFATIVMWLFVFAGSPVPYAQMLATWFDRRRGMAIAIMFAAGSIGIAFWPRYAAFLIAHLGWRHAYIWLGVSAGTIIFASSAVFIRNPPKQTQPNLSDPLSGVLLRHALTTSSFWKVAVAFSLLTAILGGAAVTFPVVLRHQGADPAAAASIMTIVGISMFAGRLSLGMTLDRFFAPHVTIAVAAVAMLGFAVMVAGTSASTAPIAAACIGFGLGSEYAAAAYIVSRAFGVRSFGAIYGAITTATSVGAAVGPAMFATAIVSSASVPMLFAVAAALLLVPIAILATLRSTDLPYHRASSLSRAKRP